MRHFQVAKLLLLYVVIAIKHVQLCSGSETYSNISCIASEREALLAFKDSLIDESNHLSLWTGENCCAWEGVECSKRTGHVVKLDLHNQMVFDSVRYFYDELYAENYSKSCLGGELNPSLLNLEHLHYLDLSLNNFSGIGIPRFFGFLSNLNYLDLSGSGFHGKIPRSLGNLSGLVHLHLGDAPQGWNFGSDYTLTTKNLWWIAKLSSLENLYLSGVLVEEAGDWLYAINMLSSLSSLNLAYCGLQFIPPLSHVNFTSLTSLDLHANGFFSPIPLWLFNLTSLTNVDLYLNYFHSQIPDLFSQLPSLAHLDLTSNSLSYSLPNSLCNVSSLANLYLSYNGIHGSIPHCIGELPSLTVLDLESNLLSGTIATSLGQLAKLERLSLSYNPFKGVLSELHFLKLTQLKGLAISATLLSLNVSSLWIPPFQLQYIYMGSIRIGPKFPEWLRTQNEVETLILSNASISDTIPDWFEVVCSDISYLDLSQNLISGKSPRIQKTYNDYHRSIYLHANRFEGSLNSFPSDAQVVDVSGNFFTGSISDLDASVTMPNLQVVSLNDNLLSGNIPKCLCNAQRLLILDLSNNRLSGRIPFCLGNLRDLKVLHLGNNSFHGQIPSSLGNIEFLKLLYLNKNKFDGQLPGSLQNLKILEILDLGENALMDTIPAWIGDNFLDLRILRLQSNKFYGNITQQLCSLAKLQVLNLAQNKLGGYIPHCFNNFRAMASNNSVFEAFSYPTPYHYIKLSDITKGRNLEYSSNLPFLKSLGLSENNIVGEIPEELMVLIGLQSLNLSRNHLSGRIPEKIGDLKQLESLDLSRNQFFGSIPSTLSNLNSLSVLNLSFNKLSGRIPSGNQLQTLDDQSIYIGNSGLCGKPLNICLDDQPSKPKKPTLDHEDKEEEDLKWFYLGLEPGFVVGFLGVVCVLLFNKSYRYAYFQFLDNVNAKVWKLPIKKITDLRRCF